MKELPKTRQDFEGIPNAYYVLAFCAVHIVRLIIVGSTIESTVVGDLFAVSFI